MTKIIQFPLPLSLPSRPGFQCVAANPVIDSGHHKHEACEAAGEPATLIGLALSFARQGPLFDGVVPPLILDRLDTHANHGNPACRMVLNWIDRHRKVEAEAVAADQPVDQVYDEAAIANLPAWQIQGEVRSLGNVADIAEAVSIAGITDFADDSGGIQICGIGSRSSRDLVLSKPIVAGTVAKPNPEAKPDPKSGSGPIPKQEVNPQPRPNSESHPNGKFEFRPKPNANLKHDPDSKRKAGHSLKSGLRSRKHSPIAEIISAKTIKINEELSHG